MKFRWYVDDGFVVGERWREFEIPDEDLEGMADWQIEDEAEEWAKEEMWEHCSLIVQKVENDDDE